MKKLTKKLRDKDHNIWEIWCSWAAESVYSIGEPTQKEIEEIVLLNWKEAYETYKTFAPDDCSMQRFIEKFIVVEKEYRIYTSNK